MTGLSDRSGSECRRNAWAVALAGGVLVALMLLFVAHAAVLKSLAIGAVFALALGLFLVWAFCTGPAAEAAVTPAVTPAITPAVTPPAAPVAAPTPTPTAPSAAPAPVAEAAPPAVAAPAPVPAPAAVDPLPASPEPPGVAAGASAGRPRAPAAFVSAIRATPTPAQAVSPPASHPAPEAAATERAVRPPSTGGLDAALAKSKDEPPAPAPEMLTAPRGGRADDLKQIRGIGPKLEKLLNEVGVWHFDQIASWKAKDIAHVDEMLVGFRGRITRDEWVRQAKVLAAGGATEFSERVKKGDVY